MLQAPGGVLDAAFLQLVQAWTLVSDGHVVWEADGCQLELLHKCFDRPLQTWHVVLLCYAAAVQQVVNVDDVLIAAVDVVHQACDSGWAVAQPDTVHCGIADIMEHAPATAFGSRSCFSTRQCARHVRQACLLLHSTTF